LLLLLLLLLLQHGPRHLWQLLLPQPLAVPAQVWQQRQLLYRACHRLLRLQRLPTLGSVRQLLLLLRRLWWRRWHDNLVARQL
jgi:hypothetical protein